MVLLVVASPCALVASIMPATLAAISNGAKSGILFKGGVHLENVSEMKAIALDKTGTLTQGKPIVTDFFVREDLDHSRYTDYLSNDRSTVQSSFSTSNYSLCKIERNWSTPSSSY